MQRKIRSSRILLLNKVLMIKARTSGQKSVSPARDVALEEDSSQFIFVGLPVASRYSPRYPS
jgi:hypothetical protein